MRVKFEIPEELMFTQENYLHLEELFPCPKDRAVVVSSGLVPLRNAYVLAATVDREKSTGNWLADFKSYVSYLSALRAWPSIQSTGAKVPDLADFLHKEV